jgi:hypothetical protein
MIRRFQVLYEALERELDGSFELRRTGGLLYFLDECQRQLMESIAAERRRRTGLDQWAFGRRGLVAGAETETLMS